MAWSTNNTSSGSGASSPLTIAHTVNAGANKIMIAVIGIENYDPSGTTVASVVFNGSEAFTKVDNQVFDSPYDDVEVWYLLNPTETTANVVITTSAALGDGGMVAIIRTVNGLKQQAQEASNKASGTGTDVGVNVTTLTDNCLLIDVCGIATTSRTITQDAGQTGLGVTVTQDIEIEGSTKDDTSSHGSIPMGWTVNQSDAWGQVAAAFEIYTEISGLSVNVSDTISLVESVGPLQNLGNISITDSLTLSELIMALLDIKPNVTDTFTLDELIQLFVSIEPTISDTLSLNEVIITRLSDLGINITDTISLAEFVQSVMSGLGIDISDSISFTEAVTATVSALADLSIDISDAVSLVESIVAKMSDLGISISDTLTFTDVVTILFDILNISVSDAVSITEAITARLSGLEIDIADTFSVSEAVTIIFETLGDLSASVSDAISLVEYVAVAKDILFSVTDTISLAEAVTVAVGVAFGWVSLDGISFYAS